MDETQKKPYPIVKIEEEIQGAYLEYAMSVIVGRALPHMRDGLKPVHRRILWSMQEQGNFHDKKYVKSARIVGDVIGKYHPHGDAPVYGAMVRMAQDFAQRYPLVDGQGNFGSIDGDNPAAMRYTEARMTKIGGELLRDIDKDTVDFTENYDGSLKEPEVLPARVPNLLINGSSGIAVGMSTNIPPHNMNEVVRACVAMIDKPDISVQELIELVPGPDFPTKGIIANVGGAHNAYRNGRGSFVIKGRAEIEPTGKDREAIIVTELPYMVNKANWILAMAALVRDKVIPGISDIRDESNKNGIRVVIELKRGEQSNVILNTLYAKTQLKTSFGINFLAIDDNRPKTFNIQEYISTFLNHRKEVVTRRTLFELRKAEAKEHILEGLKIALENIDAVVELIKKAADAKAAKVGLQDKFSLSEKQAQAILDMRLHRLTALETEKLIQELKEIKQLIADLKKILSSDEELFKVIRIELEEILDKYKTPRLTEISTEQDRGFVAEDFVRDEQVVVTVSNAGYCKRSTVDTYRAQGRGGKGVKGATTSSDEDFVSQIFAASTLSYILCFTNQGRLHWLKVHRIPEMSRTAKGRPLAQLLQLDKGEKVLSILPVKKFEENTFVVMATKQGLIKKTDLMAFSNVRQAGIIALSCNDGDELVGARLAAKGDRVFMATRAGQSIMFMEDDVRPMGRTAKGVRGVNLKKDDDAVVAMAVLPAGEDEQYKILTISENGYGKRTDIGEYRVQGRGGSGIINLKVSAKNGPVVSVRKVKDGDDVMVISNKGKLIRTPVNNISTIGRSTQGVRVITLSGEETVNAIAIISERADVDVDTDKPVLH